MNKFTVNICTYNRTDKLQLLLRALDQQALGDIADGDVTIVLVDNSPEASAEPVAQSYRDDGRFRLEYVHESRRGLANARNTALDVATSASDLLLFIDDDEVPSATWIAELVAAMDTSGADAAVGPVTPIFEAVPPIWALDNTEYAKRLPVKAGLVADGYTCNAALRASSIRDLALRFDPRFNETGGEDTIFFQQMMKAGCTVAWAERAEVMEWVPAYRLKLKWLLQRWYRTGGVEAYLSGQDASALSRRVWNIARGGARIVLGTGLVIIMLPVGGLRDFRGSLRGVRTVCRGAGLITTALGFRHLEYSRPSYA